MKLLICLCVICLLIVPVLAGEISLYPTETQLSRDPIIESSFVMKEESKSEVKEIAPITIEIVPFLSSGAKLSRTIEAKELPMQQVVTSLVKHNNRGVIKEKVVQQYPEAILEMSDNAETVKQTTQGDMKLELYYDYQKSISEPWSKYYKVEKCDASMCKVVRADFATRTVTVSEITLAQANGISGIPAYEALP